MAIAAAELSASLGTWASHAGVSRDVFRRIITEQGVQPVGKRGGHPVYGATDVIRALLANAGASDDPDSMRPFDRKAHYQAEHEKLRLQIERGELVPSIEVEQEIGGLCKRFAQWTDTLPDIMERDVGMPALMLARMERALDEAREMLYQAENRDSEDDGTGSAVQNGA